VIVIGLRVNAALRRPFAPAAELGYKIASAIVTTNEGVDSMASTRSAAVFVGPFSTSQSERRKL
jgi:hypothetical protein